MKQNIHPTYETLSVKCSCGNTFETKSTRTGSINLDVCDKCHPFYTGTQKIVDTGGRVDRFKKRFGGFGTKK